MSLHTPVSPLDEHNQQLIANVHPDDWQNPRPASRYNLVVLGAGTAGLVTAAGAAGLGAKVALVERNLMGGDCLNVGCVPSKAVIRSSRALKELERACEFGISASGGHSDFSRVMERLRRLRADISHHDSVRRFSDLGIDVFLGEAHFTNHDQVSVDGSTLHFKKAVIATGARAARPPIPGLEEAGFLTNESVFNLTELPGRLAVVGGGPIGCEMAQAFARLGSEVTLIEMAPQFLAKEDPDAAAILEKSMRSDGVEILLETRVVEVATSESGKRLKLDREDGPREIEIDEILVGVGRIPNLDALNLEAAGVEYDSRQGVQVNDRLQTSNSRIYAAGDVCLKHKFTHTADATARIVIQNALFLGSKKASALTIPWCTYTSPEIAHVGLYEDQAKKEGQGVDTYKILLEGVDRAVLDGEAEGFVKVHVKEGTDEILGATIVGEHAGEMISEITLAMVAGIGLGKIANVIHPYPTQAEAIRKAGDAYNKTRLTPLIQKIFKQWLKWTR